MWDFGFLQQRWAAHDLYNHCRGSKSSDTRDLRTSKSFRLWFSQKRVHMLIHCLYTVACDPYRNQKKNVLIFSQSCWHLWRQTGRSNSMLPNCQNVLVFSRPEGLLPSNQHQEILAQTFDSCDLPGGLHEAHSKRYSDREVRFFCRIEFGPLRTFQAWWISSRISAPDFRYHLISVAFVEWCFVLFGKQDHWFSF